MSVDFTSIFYPTSPSIVADPQEAVAALVEQYSKSLSIGTIVDFSDFIIESTLAKPENADCLLQTALSISHHESLPTVYWTSDRPKSTFAEIFHVDFRDKLHSNLSISDISERGEFLNGSFIAGRVRSLRLMTSPETVGAVAEGLKFPDEVIYNSTGEIAEIRALGSCLQLLGSASTLIESSGDRFAVEKVIKSLEGIKVSALDEPLVNLTIRHLQQTPLKDLTSPEIVQSTQSAGWHFRFRIGQ